MTEAIYSADFAAWYAAYPRKRAPGDAWKAWQAIRARPALPDLLAALEWQRKSADWLRDRGQFVPYPATYLRGRQWEDDPAPLRLFREPAAPVQAAAVVRSMPMPPPIPRHDDAELRADYTAAFPGMPWPDRSEAMAALIARDRRAIYAPREREPGEEG